MHTRVRAPTRMSTHERENTYMHWNIHTYSTCIYTFYYASTHTFSYSYILILLHAHMHTYTCAYAYIHICKRIHTHSHTHTYTFSYSYIRIRIHTHLNTHTYTFAYAYIHMRIRIHTHLQTHTYTFSYAHIQIDILIHTRTHPRHMYKIHVSRYRKTTTKTKKSPRGGVFTTSTSGMMLIPIFTRCPSALTEISRACVCMSACVWV